MGNKNSNLKDNLKPGDHIYTWRTAGLYSHHGIYIGDGKVIHFNPGGVESSSLDSFLAGGDLSLFDYGVSQVNWFFRQGRNCTIATSDPPDEVISRAKILLSRNGFGDYHVVENNCEDFAVYCKTSLVVDKSYVLGRTGQANLASVAGVVRKLSSLLGGGFASVSLSKDIGMRRDAKRVPVETLMARES